MNSEGNCIETEEGSGSVTYITDYLVRETNLVDEG